MEFWGVEVRPGEMVKCDPGFDKYLHLSQASLGEVKKEKGNENIPLFVKLNDQKLVIGTLSADKCAHISYDLVFEQEFELSHNWKNGSVFFVGYKTIISDEEPDDYSDFESDDDMDLHHIPKANGKLGARNDEVKTKATAPKAESLAAKTKVKAGEQKKGKEEEGDDEDDDEDSDEDESDDEEMFDGGEESSDEDEDDKSSDKEDEATPKKAETGKKRAAESASKTPAPEKKAKLVTPVGGQKTGGVDGKKTGHTATPHPAKQAGKTPAMKDKQKSESPKSSGSVSCKSCSKTFNTENALQAHSKAKHSAGK